MNDTFTVTGRETYKKIHGKSKGDEEQSYIDLNPKGNHIYAIIYDVKHDVITSKERLEKIVDDAVKKENFKVLSTSYAEFDSEVAKAYTIVKIISESHVVLSTYPEFNSVELDITSCRGPDSGWMAFSYIVSKLSKNPGKPNLRTYDVQLKKSAPQGERCPA